MRMVMISNGQGEDRGETFAERAEEYYRKRPQLLALLQDLYNGYITLLDRCQQTKRRLNPRDQQDEGSETESTLSYQPPPAQENIVDDLVAELVIKNVENEFLANQLGDMDQQRNDCLRKIELLKMLLELLESERVMLLNDNVRLGHKVSAVLEEKNVVASEAMFMKRKAAELARCLLRMRDDYRTCILRQKIEDLQEQIFFLEKRNKEYHEQLKRSEMKVMKKSNSCCFQRRSKKTGFKLWERVKNADLFMCGVHHNGSS
ncbi:hypothetical protein SLEP1_g31468 [Rubroshorea leprosula]|uniref:NAB domain-containing protein n=1 Tax=Rubroshorea leprosula TaxID=152421 RepID=A0AAV5KAU1_9ROSI|nr:hypothetical protein SLEP1_g31468 [Rubroshorea leprosula]